MPRVGSYYVCPCCQEGYATEREARRCMERHMDEEIFAVYHFFCIFCDKAFKSDEACRAHEAGCSRRGNSIPAPVRCCDNCDLCTLEMYRMRPCPAYNFADNRPACAEWRQAMK